MSEIPLKVFLSFYYVYKTICKHTMNEKEELFALHQSYSNRVNQLENWRHIQVAFVYTVLVPGATFLCLGKDFNTDNFINLTLLLFMLFPITSLCTLFDVWSQKRVLVLAIALNKIEMLDNFVTLLEEKSTLYWKLDKKRALLYVFITQFSFLLQLLIYVFVFFKLFCTQGDSFSKGLILIIFIVLGMGQTFLMFRLLRTELKKILR